MDLKVPRSRHDVNRHVTLAPAQGTKASMGGLCYEQRAWMSWTQTGCRRRTLLERRPFLSSYWSVSRVIRKDGTASELWAGTIVKHENTEKDIWIRKEHGGITDVRLAFRVIQREKMPIYHEMVSQNEDGKDVPRCVEAWRDVYG